MQLFNQKDIDRVQFIIDTLLESVSGKGLKLSLLNEVLCRELIYSTSNQLSTSTIIRILNYLKTNNKNSVEDFNHAFQLINKNKQTTKKCIVVLPYENITFKTSFNIAGRTYKIVQEKRLSIFVDYKKIIADIKSHIELKIRNIQFPQKLLITEIEAANVFDAWEKIRNNFSVFQGIYDYGLLFDNWSIVIVLNLNLLLIILNGY